MLQIWAKELFWGLYGVQPGFPVGFSFVEFCCRFFALGFCFCGDLDFWCWVFGVGLFFALRFFCVEFSGRVFVSSFVFGVIWAFDDGFVDRLLF